MAPSRLVSTLSHLENDRDVSAYSGRKSLVIARETWCVFSRVQKGTLGLTHEGCVLQRVSLGALSDVTVVFGMRQSIGVSLTSTLLVRYTIK